MRLIIIFFVGFFDNYGIEIYLCEGNGVESNSRVLQGWRKKYFYVYIVLFFVVEWRYDCFRIWGMDVSIECSNCFYSELVEKKFLMKRIV